MHKAHEATELKLNDMRSNEINLFESDTYFRDLSFPPKLHFALSDEVAHHRKYLLEAWLKIILKHFVDTNPDFQASPTKQTLLVIFNFFQ